MPDVGTVKWYSPAKGYGFIRREDGEEFFVHHSGIADQIERILWDGEKVHFEITEGPHGPQARNVHRLKTR